MRRLAILLLIAAVACAAARGETDATARICASVEDVRVPTVTPESAADADWLKNCAEDDLYYGASPHQDVDYAAARRCALYDWNVRDRTAPVNSDDSTGLYDLSTQTLAMIYANGDGVPRDLDLAIHLVCKDAFSLQNSDQGNSESDHQIDLVQEILKLAKMRSADSPERFDYCNGGARLSEWPEKLVCESINTRLARKKREAHLAEVVAPWTEEQKNAFSKVRTTFNQFEFIEEQAENNCPVPVELCNFDIDDRLERDFVAAIDGFEQGKLPALKRWEYGDAKYALSDLYQQLESMAFQSNRSRMYKLRDAEHAWQEYRDAFVEFAKLRWPSVSEDSWLTLLDKERMEQLRRPPVH